LTFVEPVGLPMECHSAGPGGRRPSE
jgi:hypothetical protein